MNVHKQRLNLKSDKEKRKVIHILVHNVDNFQWIVCD